MKTISKDITDTSLDGTITCLRSCNYGKRYIVAQGKDWYAGLKDGFREFNEYTMALDYFYSTRKD